MNLAVIPARGGSKRIPRKNIKLFAGKPIIAYSIESARTSELFDMVIVSTDDEEIAAVARQFGAEVPFMRPANLADDRTGTADVVKHALRWCQSHGQAVDLVCCLYATAPFVRVQDLQRAENMLRRSSHGYAFSVTRFPFAIQRALRVNTNREVEAIHPEHMFTRSQDLAEAFHDAGQFYWGRAQAFLDDVPLFSRASLAVELPPHQVQDINTPADWLRAELMFRAWHLDQRSGA